MKSTRLTEGQTPLVTSELIKKKRKIKSNSIFGWRLPNTWSNFYQLVSPNHADKYWVHRLWDDLFKTTKHGNHVFRKRCKDRLLWIFRITVGECDLNNKYTESRTFYSSYNWVTASEVQFCVTKSCCKKCHWCNYLWVSLLISR